jgi:hypothetical protein
MTSTTRRAALTALAGVPALALPVVAVASISPDALGALGAEFEAAWAAERALDDDVLEGEAAEVIFDRTSAVVREIIAAKAMSLADFRVKARALLWCYSGDFEEMIGVFCDPTWGPTPTTDLRILRSILTDLVDVEALGGRAA